MRFMYLPPGKSESEDTQVKDVEYSNLKPWINGELWSARS